VDPNLEAQRARQRENLCAIPVEHRGRQGFVPRCDVNGQAVTVESALRDLAESFVEDDAEMAEVLAELRRRQRARLIVAAVEQGARSGELADDSAPDPVESVLQARGDRRQGGAD
jgi:hypothetical protein